MKDPVQELDESTVTARLKELLRDVSLILDSASEAQKRRLLSLMEELRPQERRRHARKPCAIAVTCTMNRVFADYIKNISRGGVFIETAAPCLPGDHLAMMFSVPHQEEPVKVMGTVVRRAPEGVGVRFTSAGEDFEDMIEGL
jgi:uncharacterized protein (TIGR02266 family)